MREATHLPFCAGYNRVHTAIYHMDFTAGLRSIHWGAPLRLSDNQAQTWEAHIQKRTVHKRERRSAELNGSHGKDF